MSGYGMLALVFVNGRFSAALYILVGKHTSSDFLHAVAVNNDFSSKKCSIECQVQDMPVDDSL